MQEISRDDLAFGGDLAQEIAAKVSAKKHEVGSSAIAVLVAHWSQSLLSPDELVWQVLVAGVDPSLETAEMGSVDELETGIQVAALDALQKLG